MDKTTARKILANIDTMRAEDAAAVEQARANLTDALSKEPWVKALIEMASAQRLSNTTHALKHEAETTLNPAHAGGIPNSIGSITTRREGDHHPGFLIDPLVQLIDRTAEVKEQEGHSAAQERVNTRAREFTNDQPTETYQHTLEDGTHLTITRDVITGATTAKNPDGTTYTPPKPPRPADADVRFLPSV